MEEDIQQILKSFLEQAKTNNLTTHHFPRYYLGLRMKVGFGQGTTAKIPWISFLGEGQSTSQGIYPVYLYYKDINKLILAYGISETNPPSINWRFKDTPPTIEESFSRIGLNPKRYGNSYFYKEYNPDISFINWDEASEDLKKIITEYKAVLGVNEINTEHVSTNDTAITIENESNEKGLIDTFEKVLKAANLKFKKKHTTCFVAALITKPFVILTGLSGSGKTKLALAFAKWITESEDQYCFIPVGSDWTNREPLLGFPNALENDKYIKPENKVIDIIIEANKNTEKPYFIILDEMNLSHVERYFADFLSVMEAPEEKIKLHDGPGLKNGVPPALSLPKNIFIIGTVNVDETTYMFSPKVLDRAHVIEFRVSENEMKEFLANPTKPDLDSIRGLGKEMASDFISKSLMEIDDFEDIDDVKTILLEFFGELKKIGAEFGYRAASEIYRFAVVMKTLQEDNEKSWSLDDIIDAAIIQKLLPKIHGSRSKLENVLNTLASLCYKEKESFNVNLKPDEIDYNNRELIKYPLSLEKINRMRSRVLQDGFTSFTEA